MNKAELIAKIEEELRRELATLLTAAKAAHEAATHEESRAEDQHDTRGLEASYLAGAQAARAAEIERQLQIFQAIPRTPLPAGSRISAGALVELLSEGRKSYCLLSPSAGGLTLNASGDAGGVRIQVITPQSPLGEALLGSRSGEEVEIETSSPSGATRVFKILTVS